MNDCEFCDMPDGKHKSTSGKPECHDPSHGTPCSPSCAACHEGCDTNCVAL